jgi:hypothetical protein
MNTQVEKKQGKFTLELPKNGNGPEIWSIQLTDIQEDIYVAASRLFRKEGKELEGMKFLIRNLFAGGDNINDVCKDWKAVYASAEQIMSLLPEAQGRLKKN